MTALPKRTIAVCVTSGQALRAARLGAGADMPVVAQLARIKPVDLLDIETGKREAKEDEAMRIGSAIAAIGAQRARAAGDKHDAQLRAELAAERARVRTLRVALEEVTKP